MTEIADFQRAIHMWMLVVKQPPVAQAKPHACRLHGHRKPLAQTQTMTALCGVSEVGEAAINAQSASVRH